MVGTPLWAGGAVGLALRGLVVRPCPMPGTGRSVSARDQGLRAPLRCFSGLRRCAHPFLSHAGFFTVCEVWRLARPSNLESFLPPSRGVPGPAPGRGSKAQGPVPASLSPPEPSRSLIKGEAGTQRGSWLSKSRQWLSRKRDPLLPPALLMRTANHSSGHSPVRGVCPPPAAALPRGCPLGTAAEAPGLLREVGGRP